MNEGVPWTDRDDPAFGPASQREQQDRFIERHGLVDTGLVFHVAQSGTTVWRSATMSEMLAAARAGAVDLLLAGYSALAAEPAADARAPGGRPPACVALAMCDRRILSSDPHDRDELISEAAAAEKYSRRLSERITDGYAAKFDRHDDPGGHAGLGFRAGLSRRTPSRSTPRRSESSWPCSSATHSAM